MVIKWSVSADPAPVRKERYRYSMGIHPPGRSGSDRKLHSWKWFRHPELWTKASADPCLKGVGIHDQSIFIPDQDGRRIHMEGQNPEKYAGTWRYSHRSS